MCSHNCALSLSLFTRDFATCGTSSSYCNANPYQCEKSCSGNWIEHVVKPNYPPKCIPLWEECQPPSKYGPSGGGYYKPPLPCCGSPQPPPPPCHDMAGAVCTAGAPDCKCDPPPIEEPSGGGYGGGYRPKKPLPICYTYSRGGYSQCIPENHAHQYGYGGIQEDEDMAFLMNSMSMSISATEEDDGGEIEWGEFGDKNLRS